MAEAVAKAIENKRHLVVQAGTGTGKSLAYLVPALALGCRIIVSTATKALQDQLAHRDLPRLQRSLGHPFSFAVLKGRSNYICRQRVNEIAGGPERSDPDQQLDFGEQTASARGPLAREVQKLVEWANGAGDKRSIGTFTGDRAELPFEPSEAAWGQVSMGWRECPGVAQCPSGGDCFAEIARRRAAEADVVVVNTHLYAASLALGQDAELLPAHDLVVFDEAHELEDIASAALGFELSPGRVAGVARMVNRAARTFLPGNSPAGRLEDAAGVLGGALRIYRDKLLPRPLDGDLPGALTAVREESSRLGEELRKAARAREGGGGPGPAGSGGAQDMAALQRAQKSLSHLVDDANALLDLPPSHVAWVEGPEHAPALRVAPLHIGPVLAGRLWQSEDAPTAILTSATIPMHLGERVGLGAGSFDQLDVGSPFSYGEQAMLYCPVDLPDPRAPGFEAAMHEELCALIEAAEGRALCLFTSWRAMQAAANVVKSRVSWRIFTQSDLPKPKLVSAFAADEHSCLFATMGFWQGVDVPGRSLSLVTIDRLPFPRPDDPLLVARREAAGARAFELVDVPRSATLLAQGVGRLVRAREDRGVVAVFDRRLGKARYRWQLVNALPPMRRTRSRAEVAKFLASLS